MSLSDIAQVVISTDAPGITRQGFGTICLAAYHTKYSERFRVYTDTTGLITDGFAATDPAYRMVERAFQQDPRPESVILGRLANPVSHVIRLTPNVQNTRTYSVTVAAGAQVGTASYTSDGTATAAEICTGLAAAITALALTGVTATGVSGTYVQISGTAGLIIYCSGWDRGLLSMDESQTADPGIAADLAAIRQANDSWYFLGIECNAKLIAKAASAYVESLGLGMFGTNTSDADAPNSGSTTDLGYELKALTTGRTVCVADSNDTANYKGIAAIAERAPHDVADGFGGGTWAFKRLKGAAVDKWTPTELTNLRAKNYETFITTADVNHTLDGKVSGGEFADVVRGIDWLKIRIAERDVQAKFNNQKIPFTDKGVSIIQSLVLAQLQEGVDGGLLADDPKPVVTVPSVKNVSSTDKGNRTLPSVKFSATLAGAIHLTKISGVVSK